MKSFFTMLLMSLCCLSSVVSQTKAIAHRGYWDVEGSAQNSVASLQKAQEIAVYGSEFDVLVTSDDIPVLNHDDRINGLLIENTPYSRLKELVLKNGEKLPTLENYLTEGEKNPALKLILEIKPHSTSERENNAVSIILNAVKEKNMKSQVEYISFSLNICKELIRQDAQAKVAYLNGDKTPSELKELGLTGLDYHYKIILEHPEWITEAHRLGLTVNVWTVNKEEIMEELIRNQVDFITTDNPVLLIRKIQELSIPEAG